jgi:hypothetical protein
MKKHLQLLGLLSALLMAGMLLTACPTDGGGGEGDGVPTPGSLPVLPDGVAYVASEAEAKALLTAIGPVFESVGGSVQSLIYTAQEDSEDSMNTSWNISGDTESIDGLKVTSKGSYTTQSEPAGFMEEGFTDYAVGNYAQIASTSDTTVELTANKTESGGVVYKGSKVAATTSGTMKISITELSGTTLKMRLTGTAEETNRYTLTASGSGKGGKIILDLHTSGSIDQDYTGSGEFPDLAYTYSGSLTVYGEGDAEVYRLPITNTTFGEATEYFTTAMPE